MKARSKLLKRVLRVVSVLFCVALAGSAGASSLLQVIELGRGQNINSIPELEAFDAFDASDLLKDGDLLFSQVVYSDTELQGCTFGSDSACDFRFDEDVDYVLFKAGSYVALYEPWDGVVHADTSDWGPLYNGGGNQFTPALSNVRGVGAVPEPSAAIVFAAGISIVGFAIRRRAG
jgi:hypothetical protein